MLDGCRRAGKSWNQLRYFLTKKGVIVEHKDENVQRALVQLNDALCSWERATSRESVLIIREQYGFVHRSVSGKPVPQSNDDVSDDQLMNIIKG